MSAQNFAVKLCGVLQTQTENEINAKEWRLIGQEQDGSQLLTWLSMNENNHEIMNIGIYTNKSKSLKVLHTFDDKLNIIQASVNPTHTLLVYVVKSISNEDVPPAYTPYIVPLLPEKENKIEQVNESSDKQMMVQFLYGKSYKFTPGVIDDRFLLFKHLENCLKASETVMSGPGYPAKDASLPILAGGICEAIANMWPVLLRYIDGKASKCIKMYRTTLANSDIDGEEVGDGDDWRYIGYLPDPEVIVKVFSWAQWDCLNQVLYYIHYRQPAQSFAEGEDVKSPSEVTPTLSALQFHADLPHETVLNIPLSLPQLPSSGPACGVYEDDAVPLRIHDCSLDLQIVSEPCGILYICHHYLYKPLDDSTSSLVLEDSVELKESGVNFAYSVTVLHHGVVVHSVAPDLPWSLAKSLRPAYTPYGDNYLLVNIPKLFTHLLDIGLSHEPSCHVVINNEDSERGSSLAPLLGWGPNTMVNLSTLDIVTLGVTDKDLATSFKTTTSIENKLAMIHYLVQHDGNNELAEELIAWMCLNQKDGYGALNRVMQEYLIGSTYSVTKRSLPSSALVLTKLLPFTQNTKFADVKVGKVCVSVSQEKVWNSSAVVLSPRARLSQFSEDPWTRLWSLLNPLHPVGPRFNNQQVLDKLRLSLSCYQPEALSRCSTPLSPGGAPPLLTATPRRSSIVHADILPFFEVDLCTASKQEHVIAANLREVSMYLVRGGASAEGGVHAVATRWAAAQLDVSRGLCRAVVKAAAATVTHNQLRGFCFIDEMEDSHATVLFSLLEQYYMAADSIAFPLPQGFTSFFTYLGYRVLPFATFLQYVHRNVFELQIDVMKAIVAVKDTSDRVVQNKLRLIQLIGEGRAKRVLSSWSHGAALQVRAREHASALLTGSDHSAGRHTGMVQTMPNLDRLSPLDTFLDLLTAKASLNELDFNLIIEATLASLKASDKLRT